MDIRELAQKLFSGISSKLIISFTLIIIVTVFIFGWVYLNGLPFTSYEGLIENQKKKIFDGLSQIADNKKVNLLSFIDDRRSDTLVTASNVSIVSGVVHILHTIHELIEAGIDEPALWSLLTRDNKYLDIVEQLHTIRNIYGYFDNIQIADRETGIVFISTDNSTLGTDLSRELFFMNALLSRNVYVCDIKAQPEDRQPAMHFSYLLTDSQGDTAAVLIMKVDAEVITKSIFQARQLLGDTGEVLLVNQGRQILTQLKYPLADGTAAKVLQYTITALPATLASRGEEGIIETRDYRGEKVLSAYRYISLSADWGWGMVVKTDYDELFASIRVEIVNLLIMGSVSIAVLIVLFIPVIRRITGPVISLKKTAERITDGDLGVRAEILSSDEVGVLARAFNQMADSLVDVYSGLEDEVRDRTKDLETEVVEHRQTEKELENYRVHLEELVKERTAELEDSNKEIRKSQQAMQYLLEDVNEARISLQISNESLERANREMEAFSYSVSHDLRSPLRAVLGFSYKLEGRIGKNADKETLRLISVISENTIKMQTLISDILNFSRIGRTELKREQINIQSLVSEICSDFTENTDGRYPRFDILTLPDTFGTYSMIKQVFVNLIDNAVKFTRSAENPLISIGSQISEAGTVYFVKDYGSGFDMQFSGKIFDIFTRLHNDKGVEGTGVGLAIVKLIIKRHGGRVWVESEPGKGTAFYFTLGNKNEDKK